jgi:hypothetical protein
VGWKTTATWDGLKWYFGVTVDYTGEDHTTRAISTACYRSLNRMVIRVSICPVCKHHRANRKR